MTTRFCGKAALALRVQSWSKFNTSVFLQSSSFLQFSYYQRMAVAGEAKEIATFKNFELVKIYLMKELECDDALLLALHMEQVLSGPDYKKLLLLKNRTERVQTLIEKIICNLTERSRDTFYAVLIQHSYGYIVDHINEIEKQRGIMEHDLSPRFGSRIAVIKIEEESERLTNTIHSQSLQSLSNVIPIPGFTISATQYGCVEIFITSTTDPVYKYIAKEDFCREFMEQLFSMKNIKEKIEIGQKITLIVRKNSFISPLLDEQERKLGNFSKMDIVKINRSFLTKHVRKIDVLYQKVKTMFGHIENGPNETPDVDGILKLLQEIDDRHWADFINLLVDCGNEEIASRLKQTLCIECYRSTVLANVEAVLNEITTDIMEKTFQGHSWVPDVVRDSCINSKGKLSRMIRAKTFLEYVLIKGPVLISFANVFSSLTDIVLEYSPCSEHDCDKKVKPMTEPEEVTLSFVVYKDKEGKHCLKESTDESTDQKPGITEEKEKTENSKSGQINEQQLKSLQQYSPENGKITDIIKCKSIENMLSVKQDKIV